MPFATTYNDQLFGNPGYATFFPALIAAHRFLTAAAIAALPAALIFRRLRLPGFAATASVGSDSPRSLAYLARCAAAILRREAALNFFRGLPVSDGMAAGLVRIPLGNMLRSSAI